MPPSVAVAGCARLAGGMETEHTSQLLNQWLDAPSPKYPVLNHLGKPFCFQVLRKRPSPTCWWLAR